MRVRLPLYSGGAREIGVPAKGAIETANERVLLLSDSSSSCVRFFVTFVFERRARDTSLTARGKKKEIKLCSASYS